MKFLTLILILFSTTLHAADVVFALRSDNMVARYADGNAEHMYSRRVGADVPSLIASASTGVIGGNVIDPLADNSFQSTAYVGHRNMPDITQGISILMRIDPLVASSSAGNRGIFFSRNSATTTRFEINVRNGGNIKVRMQVDGGLDVVNTITTATTTFNVGTVYDVFVKWSGVSGEDFHIYVDGSLMESLTTSQDAPTHANYIGPILGYGSDGAQGYANYNEFVIWEGDDIDPTSVTLVNPSTGVTFTGSLNGSARTGWVDVTVKNPHDNTAPNLAKVISTESFTFNGVSQSGSLSLPDAEDLRLGEVFDTVTGTLDLLPASDVRFGRTQDNANIVGTLVVPAASNVQLGTSFDNGTVGTLDTITIENLNIRAGVRSLQLEVGN